MGWNAWFVQPGRNPVKAQQFGEYGSRYEERRSVFLARVFRRRLSLEGSKADRLRVIRDEDLIANSQPTSGLYALVL